ncbi:MAG: hypothetical protein LBJ43_03710 [Propionibacteriaceae bacterium]|nr:hypothetical protein [Propionibacteriaceae bacterium]
MKQRHRIAFVVLLAGVLGVSACTADTPSTPQISPGAVNTPTFTGPWAYEYKSAFNQTANFPNIKEILFDEEITTDEILSVAAETEACMVAGGARYAEMSLYGGFGIGYPPGSSEREMSAIDTNATWCEGTTGWSLIQPLYTNSRSNPGREDWSTLMAGCVVRMGIRPEGYTGEEYRRDYVDGGFTLESLAWSACKSDPHTMLSVFEVDAQCLVRVGAREPSYTATDFEREFYAQVFPEFFPPQPVITESERLTRACFDDPFYAR